MKVLFGFKHEPTERAIRNYLESYGQEIDGKTRYTKKTIEDVIRKEPDLDIVYVKEFLEGGEKYSAQEISALCDVSTARFIVIVNPSERGTDTMRTLYCAGVLDACYADRRHGAKPQLLASLAMKGRKRLEAREYYRIDDALPDYGALSYEEYQDSYAFFKGSSGDGGRMIDHFIDLSKMLSPKQYGKFMEQASAFLKTHRPIAESRDREGNYVTIYSTENGRYTEYCAASIECEYSDTSHFEDFLDDIEEAEEDSRAALTYEPLINKNVVFLDATEEERKVLYSRKKELQTRENIFAPNVTEDELRRAKWLGSAQFKMDVSYVSFRCTIADKDIEKKELMLDPWHYYEKDHSDQEALDFWGRSNMVRFIKKANEYIKANRPVVWITDDYDGYIVLWHRNDDEPERAYYSLEDSEDIYKGKIGQGISDYLEGLKYENIYVFYEDEEDYSYNPDRLNDGRDSGIALYSILQQNGKILDTATEDEKAMLKKVIR